jgi:dTMP kinase
MDWMKHLVGKFVVFDGPDGSGKSTQLRLFADLCREHGLTVCQVREPGGTSIGEQIRKVLLDPANTDMSLRCEMMLYMASRAQLIEQIIKPAIERGQFVLADRFVSSTLAYQGAASGLPIDDIMAVANAAIGTNWPVLTVIFDVDEMTAAMRMSGKERKANGKAPQPTLFADRLELRGLDYQRRVREGYLDQARQQPDRYAVVDASTDAEGVFERLLAELEKRFG